MRNLKKLLAVIITVAVLATMMVPAFAAEDTKSAAEICEAIGMLRGTTGTVTDEYLATELTRHQMAIMFLRLRGLEAEANEFDGTDNFNDAEEIKYAEGRAVLAYLKANPDLGFVGSEGNFMPLKEVEAQEYFKVMLVALGYEQGTDFEWADVLAFAAENGLASAADFEDKDFLTANDVAEITVDALKAKDAEGEVLVEKLIDAGVIDADLAVEVGLVAAEASKASVEVTGAKKMTVTFDGAVDEDDIKITVKRGVVKPSVKSITFAEDKKSAVIEFTTALAKGDYTVTISGIAEEDIVVTLAIDAEKLATIEFVSDVAILAESDGSKVTTTVKAKNQYGEDVTSKLNGVANIVSSKGDKDSITINNDGLITITGAVNEFVVDQEMVVTVVAEGIVANKTLKIARAAMVESIEIGELTTDDEDLVGKVINVGNLNENISKYYIPVVIKDQYGNELKKADLAGVGLISSNEKIINLKGFKDTDDGTVIKLQAAKDNDPTSGTVVLTVVASSTGKSASVAVEVKDNPEIDVVTLSAPEAELKINKAAILPITVVDTYGDEVALWDIDFVISGDKKKVTLNGEDTKITATNAEFSIEKDYVEEVAYLKITPTDKNVILQVTTAKAKYQSLTLTANDAPVVAGIKEVKKDLATMLANDATLSTALKDNIVFLDQYGEEIDAPEYKAAKANGANPYYVISPKDDNDKTTFDAVAGAVYATENAGTEVYLVELLDKDSETLDSIEVTVTVVDKDKITQFAIDDLNKFYTGAADDAYDQQVEIHGLVNGKKVVVNQDMIVNVSASNGLEISEKGAYSATVIDTDGKDAKSVITVLVETSNATYTVKKEVTFSDADPQAASLVAKYDDAEIKGGTVQVSRAELNKSFVPGTGASKLQFEAKDQYGVQRPAEAYNFVVTNNGTSGDVSATGTGSGFDSDADLGKSFQINVFIDGLYQSLKVVVGE